MKGRVNDIRDYQQMDLDFIYKSSWDIACVRTGNESEYKPTVFNTSHLERDIYLRAEYDLVMLLKQGYGINVGKKYVEGIKSLMKGIYTIPRSLIQPNWVVAGAEIDKIRTSVIAYYHPNDKTNAASKPLYAKRMESLPSDSKPTYAVRSEMLSTLPKYATLTFSQALFHTGMDCQVPINSEDPRSANLVFNCFDFPRSTVCASHGDFTSELPLPAVEEFSKGNWITCTVMVAKTRFRNEPQRVDAIVAGTQDRKVCEAIAKNPEGFIFQIEKEKVEEKKKAATQEATQEQQQTQQEYTEL